MLSKLGYKLVVNVVGELYIEKNSCGIAWFPCDSTAFLLTFCGLAHRHDYGLVLLASTAK